MSKTIRTEDDLLVTPVLKRRLHAEAMLDDGNGATWFVLTRSNGDAVEVLSARARFNPLDEQRLFGRDMAKVLNEKLHHDGKWIVAFTHPSPHRPAEWFTNGVGYFNRWYFLFVDQDGDPQFTVENDDRFDEVLTEGPDHWIEQAEQAYQTWHLHMREVLDGKARATATFKRAQGEAPPSVH